jgi:uncharacterized membrane protein
MSKNRVGPDGEQPLKQILTEAIPQTHGRGRSAAQRVADSFLRRTTISRDIHSVAEDDRTFGERVADRVAAFGGSWSFIFVFFGMLFIWIAINTYAAFTPNPFDPYPFILLNLFLSMLEAIQAPIILMSQNRQAAKDRLSAEHDYEVNLKAELEVRLLHEKLDELREQKWIELVEMQQQQIAMLDRLIGNLLPSENAPSISRVK